MATTQVEIWVCVDSNGDVGIGECDVSAREKYEENIGNLNEAEGFRLVKVLVTVPLPEVSTVELTAEAPAIPAASAV